MKWLVGKVKFAWYWFGAKWLGHNTTSTPPDVILAQIAERRPLPIGRPEFEVWANRILSGANVTADRDSQKAVLAGLLMHLGPTESFKEDAYFIHSLRKLAVNETAWSVMDEAKKALKAKADAEKIAAETPSKTAERIADENGQPGVPAA